MENRIETTTSSQGKGGLVALAVLAGVLFIAALGLGTAYFFEMEKVSGLERQVDELKTSAAKMDEEMAKDANAKPAAPGAKYREIPELGVKYKLTETTKDLTYRYVFEGATNSEAARFTTITLASLKDNSGSFPCADRMPSGTIIRHGGEGTPPPTNDPRVTVKQVGASYYFYSAPEVGCMIDTQDAPNFQKSEDAVKAAFDSLEAM